MSDTPRTDAHNWHDGDYDDPLDAFADFAKQLERELNAANERIKRMEEAGDWMRHHSNNDWWCEKWDETKEAKP